MLVRKTAGNRQIGDNIDGRRMNIKEAEQRHMDWIQMA
jgi:hypothetical protein